MLPAMLVSSTMTIPIATRQRSTTSGHNTTRRTTPTLILLTREPRRENDDLERECQLNIQIPAPPLCCNYDNHTIILNSFAYTSCHSIAKVFFHQFHLQTSKIDETELNSCNCLNRHRVLSGSLMMTMASPDLYLLSVRSRLVVEFIERYEWCICCWVQCGSRKADTSLFLSPQSNWCIGVTTYLGSYHANFIELLLVDELYILICVKNRLVGQLQITHSAT